MSFIFGLYTALLLIAFVTFLYSLAAYYECPNTRSHRPYIIPIFVSTGWIFLAVYGIAGGNFDKHSVAGLAVVTLLAIIVLLHYYRRTRELCHVEQS